MPIPSPNQLTTFSSLPVLTTIAPSNQEQDATGKDTYLLASIKSNLTITKPTLILSDTSGQDFALVFDPPFQVSEPRNPNAVAERFKEIGLRKGSVVVIQNARRTTVEREGGQGFVVLKSLGALEDGGYKAGEGEEDDGGYLVGVVPTGLELTKRMMEVLREKDERGPEKREEEKEEEKVCDGKADDGCSIPSGKDGDGKGLKRCQGCLEVWYCSKECQTKRWTAHKDECKTIKTLRKIWPRPEGVE